MKSFAFCGIGKVGGQQDGSRVGERGTHYSNDPFLALDGPTRSSTLARILYRRRGEESGEGGRKGPEEKRARMLLVYFRTFMIWMRIVLAQQSFKFGHENQGE